MKYGKILFSFIFLIALFTSVTTFVRSQTCNNPDDCNRLIDDYNNQIQKLQGQGNTLKNQIAQFDAQIKLTSLKITQTEEQISLLSGRIGQIQGSLGSLTKAFNERVVETYKMAKVSDPLLLLISSDSLSEAFDRFSYLKKIQEGDRNLIDRLQNAQVTYETEKSDQEDLQNKLASFASFADSKGAFLLGNQTYCDDWGCYYNQRDSQWGAILINRSNDCGGPCSLARVGCLATSVSMVVSHYGRKDILPSDIANSTSANYQVNSALLKEGTITVKGVNITRTNISSSLNPDLVKDNPVIVGIKYGPFGTHFVVIKEYRDGKYIMNDPFTEGGHDKSFTDFYSLGSVYKVNKITL